jgi:glyoxylase-like metal-dependent hydrolase (beta-lactamase superfamily II)
MIRHLEPDLFLIDHKFQGVPGTIASYLLTDRDDLTLIETGPATTIETLLAGIRAAGYDPDQIIRLIVTHIHLDHAGAAGSLIQRLPRARLFVHRVGAPHMIDPSKLLASATRIFQEDMERLWGEILPVPEERVVILDDESTLRIGDRARRCRPHDRSRGPVRGARSQRCRQDDAVASAQRPAATLSRIDPRVRA